MAAEPINQQFGMNRKYKPPPDPFELEMRKKDMVAGNQFKLERQIKILTEQFKQISANDTSKIRYLNVELRDNPEAREAFLHALGVEINALINMNLGGQIDNEYVEEFRKWLLGISTYNTEPKKTPWGTRMLTGDSIIAYIRSFVDRKKDFQTNLAALKCLGPPQDIETAWLYFKYVVTEQQDDGLQFLPEFNWWLNPKIQEQTGRVYVEDINRPGFGVPVSRTGPPNAGYPGPPLTLETPPEDQIQQAVESQAPDAPRLANIPDETAAALAVDPAMAAPEGRGAGGGGAGGKGTGAGGGVAGGSAPVPMVLQKFENLMGPARVHGQEIQEHNKGIQENAAEAHTHFRATNQSVKEMEALAQNIHDETEVIGNGLRTALTVGPVHREVMTDTINKAAASAVAAGLELVEEHKEAVANVPADYGRLVELNKVVSETKGHIQGYAKSVLGLVKKLGLSDELTRHIDKGYKSLKRFREASFAAEGADPIVGLEAEAAATKQNAVAFEEFLKTFVTRAVPDVEARIRGEIATTLESAGVKSPAEILKLRGSAEELKTALGTVQIQKAQLEEKLGAESRKLEHQQSKAQQLQARLQQTTEEGRQALEAANLTHATKLAKQEERIAAQQSEVEKLVAANTMLKTYATTSQDNYNKLRDQYIRESAEASQDLEKLESELNGTEKAYQETKLQLHAVWEERKKQHERELELGAELERNRQHQLELEQLVAAKEQSAEEGLRIYNQLMAAKDAEILALRQQTSNESQYLQGQFIEQKTQLTNIQNQAITDVRQMQQTMIGQFQNRERELKEEYNRAMVAASEEIRSSLTTTIEAQYQKAVNEARAETEVARRMLQENQAELVRIQESRARLEERVRALDRPQVGEIEAPPVLEDFVAGEIQMGESEGAELAARQNAETTLIKHQMAQARLKMGEADAKLEQLGVRRQEMQAIGKGPGEAAAEQLAVDEVSDPDISTFRGRVINALKEAGAGDVTSRIAQRQEISQSEWVAGLRRVARKPEQHPIMRELIKEGHIHELKQKQPGVIRFQLDTVPFAK